jgi:hypothetical protein
MIRTIPTGVAIPNSMTKAIDAAAQDSQNGRNFRDASPKAQIVRLMKKNATPI